MSSIHYDLTGDSRDLVREMNEATKALYRTKRAGDQTAQATKKVGKEGRTTTAVLHAFKDAAEGAGGSLGENAGRIEKFSSAFSRLASVGGGAGLALGAAGGAAALAGGSILAAALNTERLVDEMMEANQNVPIDDHHLRGVERMNEEIAESKRLFNEFTVTLGSTFAPVIGGVVELFNDGWRAARRLHEQWFGTFQAITSLGLSEVVDWESLVYGSEEAARANREYLEGLEEIGEVGGGAFDVVGRKTEDVSKKFRAQQRLIEERNRAQREGEQIYQAAADSSLNALQKINVEYDRQIARVGELVNKGLDLETAAATRAALEQQRAREVADEVLHQRDRQQQAFERQIQAEERAAQKREAAHEAELRQIQERNNAYLSSAASIAGSIESVAGLFIRSSDEMTEAAKKRARTAFRISQAAAVAQIAINTAQAIMQGYAQLGPVAGSFAAVGTTATGAAQTALVLAERPPSFERGGVVQPADHHLVSAQAGEGFLTRAGVAAAGGEEGIRAMNEQRGGGNTVVVVNRYRHRVFDAFVQDHLDRGGPIAQKIRETLGPMGHTLVTA